VFATIAGHTIQFAQNEMSWKVLWCFGCPDKLSSEKSGIPGREHTKMENQLGKNNHFFAMKFKRINSQLTGGKLTKNIVITLKAPRISRKLGA